MKIKSLIILGLALSANAFGATILQDEIISTHTDKTYTYNGGGYSAIKLSLNDSWLASNSSKPSGAVEATSFALSSFSYQQRPGNTAAAAKIIIRDNTTNQFIATSTMGTSTGSGGTMSFNFSDVTLNLSTTYTFFFVTESATVTANKTNITGGSFVSEQIAAIPNSAFNNAGTNGFADSAGTSVSTGYRPNVSLSGVMNYSIPEPSTTTLGLLGLGGLLLRRRRVH